MRLRRAGAWFTTSLLVITAVQAPPAMSREAAAETRPKTPTGATTATEAAEKARRTGERVEVLAGRGERREAWALPDGRFEVVQHLRPVRVRKNGAWVKADTTLRRSGDAIAPAAASVDLKFSAGGTGPLATMSRGGRSLSLTWPGTLPKPKLEGDTAIYRGVLGPDVDLHVRADVDGFAHTLVVKTAQAAKDPRLARLTLKMSTENLTVTRDSSGALHATAPAAVRCSRPRRR